MKFIRMSDIDHIEPPYTEILKNDSDHRHSGCASIALLNSLHFLGLLEGKRRSEVLLELKDTLQENPDDLIVSRDNFKSFFNTTNLFEGIQSALFYTKDLALVDFIEALSWGAMAFMVVATAKATPTSPLHCSVIYIKEGRLLIDGWEADLETLARILFQREKNFGFYLWRDDG